MTPFLTATWRAIAMLSYEVEPDDLGDMVPAGTRLDAWRGRHFVTLVALEFREARVQGLPIPLHRRFQQINLRSYVAREEKGELRRGVFFMKQIVSRPAVAWAARLVYGENSVSLPMRHELHLPRSSEGSTGRVRYEWRHADEWCGLSVSISGEPAFAYPDSLEGFVAERYWGYSRRPDGSTVEYRVEHPPWRFWPGNDVRLECDLASLYGERFAKALSRAPSAAVVANGSAATVHAGRHI